eukprot:5202386-Prymnesium_polylepis.1
MSSDALATSQRHPSAFKPNSPLPAVQKIPTAKTLSVARWPYNVHIVNFVQIRWVVVHGIGH